MKKIELTNEIRKRLKDEQNKANLSNKRVAAILGINETTYKNIIRFSGGNKFIKDELIVELAQHYGCSSDYLKCVSNDPNTDKSGCMIRYALDYKMRDKKTEELFNFFKANQEIYNRVHFLFCELSDPPKKEIINAIKSISYFLQSCFVFSCPANMEDKNFNIFLNNNFFSDSIYADSARSLMVANYLYANNNYQFALPEYIKIVYKTITLHSIHTKLIAKEACDKISEIQKNWSDFPQELSSFTDALPTIVDHSFFERYFKDDIKQKIETYLNKYFGNINT